MVQPKTQSRYAESFYLPEFRTFDEWVADYVEQLWEEGSPKSDASFLCVGGHTVFPASGQKPPCVELEACENLESSGAANEGRALQRRAGTVYGRSGFPMAAISYRVAPDFGVFQLFSGPLS